MSDNLHTENLSSGLATVSMLNSRFEWIDWDKTIRKQLKIAGYGDLLSRQKDRPSNSTKANIWEEKQERACYGTTVGHLLSKYKSQSQTAPQQKTTTVATTTTMQSLDVIRIRNKYFDHGCYYVALLNFCCALSAMSLVPRYY